MLIFNDQQEIEAEPIDDEPVPYNSEGVIVSRKKLENTEHIRRQEEQEY